ncbi:MAG TPA: PIG-L family deacetylase [Bryobacteraceae bacterium]|jgi:LmbE family N-acetylglucosaminyl deacetylase
MIRNYLRQAYRAALPMLYARSRFKLFLSSTFGDLDLRRQQLASLTDYFSSAIRPLPIRAPFGKSMLVVAPHQDDETIGCGGALALQVRSGSAAAIVMVHDGADGHDDVGMDRKTLVELRNEESRRAAGVLNLAPPVFLNHPRLSESFAQAAEELRSILAERKVDAVFTPFLLDGHPDHRTTNQILAAALEKIPWDVRVLGYEVWGLCVPNVLVIIDDVIEDKLKMLSCFTFANQAVDYVHTTKGLNMYRSRLLGAGECRYAECFFEVPREEFIDLARRVQAAAKD